MKLKNVNVGDHFAFFYGIEYVKLAHFSNFSIVYKFDAADEAVPFASCEGSDETLSKFIDSELEKDIYEYARDFIGLENLLTINVDNSAESRHNGETQFINYGSKEVYGSILTTAQYNQYRHLLPKLKSVQWLLDPHDYSSNFAVSSGYTFVKPSTSKAFVHPIFYLKNDVDVDNLVDFSNIGNVSLLQELNRRVKAGNGQLQYILHNLEEDFDDE